MTLLSRKADYALLILSYLYRREGGANARLIADHYGLSRGFVANILKELCQHEFVASTRGANGGYILARDMTNTSFAELLEAVDDGFRLAVCNPAAHSETDGCTIQAVCPVKGPMAEVHRRLTAVLQGVSLAELFGRVSPPALQIGLSLLDDHNYHAAAPAC